ncbi:Ribosomal RNA large subunit methyltransferase I [Hydrogenophaga sp. T4]|nr:Ribosomal RNA large subunit methyltransferase I [Hydrogenophaga sp. T4]
MFQSRHEGRSETRLMAGSVPEPHVVTERGARYLVHVLKGQNHGLFLDMAEGRQWVREHAAGAKVLNLFAYTCAFSVAALQGGAKQVVNVDMSAVAIAIGQQNHALNGLQAGASFLAHDIFKTWGKLTRSGPTTSSSWTRRATRKAASSPPKTTPASCAACRTCCGPTARCCCVSTRPSWTPRFCRIRCAKPRPN